MTICRICGNERDNSRYVAREMMFGFRDRFDYFQCSRCGCLQIAEFPDDMRRYYPSNYYSFVSPDDPERQSPLKRFLKAQRLDHWLGRRTPLGELAELLFGDPAVNDKVLLEIRDTIRLRSDSAVLDVGCGKGGRLLEWDSYGFSDLSGFDPYIDDEIRYRSGVTIFRSMPSERGRYGFVMMNHSFEHMPDAKEVLRRVAEIVDEDHTVMIAVPLCSSLAWEKYGVDWVQMDAPRHFYLHSLESMHILAEQTGFEVVATVHNSTAFQFWGSEQYLREIPLCDPTSYASGAGEAAFSAGEIGAFEEQAKELNRLARGDQASFYLRLRR